VNERPFFGGEMSANYSEILPDGCMVEKLANECVSIRLGFCKEKDPGRETVDAMYDKRSLSARLQFCGKKGPSGLSFGAFHRHGIKAGGFIKGHDGVVLVKHDKLS
jgi:hypothetical protein